MSSLVRCCINMIEINCKIKLRLKLREFNRILRTMKVFYSESILKFFLSIHMNKC